MSSPESSPAPRRYGVGYALAPKKQQSFIQPSLLSLAASRGIDLVAIDPQLPLASQGQFDLIIHKLCSAEWKSQLRDFASRYPGVPVIDDPEAIERLHNRISMLDVVSTLSVPQENETFGIPNQVVIYNPDSLSDPALMETLRFPMIAKPLVADGSEKSHKMSLVYNRDGLLKLKPPIVLQEFVNHGGVIFKVYVVGDYVKCVRRRSLPDVSEENLEHHEGSLSFSQVSNVGSQDQVDEMPDLEDAEMPPMDFIAEIARGLRKAMGLHLFNFDVIRDVKVGNRYLVIDINYFPGYAKMPAYEGVLTDFLWNIVHGKRTEDVVVVEGDNDVVSNHSGAEDSSPENAG